LRFAAGAAPLLALLMGTPVMAVEEPRYELIKAQADFELRRYPPLLVAETLVSGDMDEASRKGFRLLADFIFGNNQLPASAASEKIAMTAPVTVQATSTKIAMTAPVTLEPQGGASDTTQWRVHFVMPSQYTLATIAKPRNEAVRLRELPAQWIVAHRFSGFTTAARVESKTQEALHWAAEQGLKVLGAAQLARYDPPWTLPMFRRNEILLQVQGPADQRGP
jgi:hypothetical protein